MVKTKQEHGGGIDSAADHFGGIRADWIDLSTGINPVPYAVGTLASGAWTALPDVAAQDALIAQARRFWQVPEGAAVLATPGASAPIAMIPHLAAPAAVQIAGPTYNEHAAAFAARGWHETGSPPAAQVIVHPNNPDGRLFAPGHLTAPLRIIDESFCDVMPEASLIAQAARTDTLVLKSFGKFWGLAGLRLGFVIGAPDLVGRLAQMLGPWPVSGPALAIGTRALEDPDWAATSRTRLQGDAARLDGLLTAAGADCIGGTTLFRLFDVPDALAWQTRLARHQIWSRVFSYNPRWLRLGIPPPDGWPRLERALK